MQDHDRRAAAAPIDIVQPDAVDFYVAFWGSRLWARRLIRMLA